MLTDIFKNALPILENLEKNNFEAYFVGGCVRDLLLGRPIKDIDITTSATPDEVQEIFPKVIPVGIEHGTVIVRHQGESYEVTTFREDGSYTDNRHPDQVSFIRNIAEDLKRRDFTINALAMDKSGAIIDMFEGQRDINQKIIQTVGDGTKRFKEDALRIIRALRFSSQIGFEIEKDTLTSMIACKQDINHLSTERITNEIEKFFAGSYVEKGIDYLKQTNIYQELPILKQHPYLIEKLPKRMIPLPSIAVVFALFHYKEPSISIHQWVKEWKCSNQVKREAFELIDNLVYYEKYSLDTFLIYQLRDELIQAFILLVKLLFDKEIIHEDIVTSKMKLPIRSRAELLINGNDLLQLFPEIDKGPWIKTLLETIEKKVVTGELTNNYHEIKEWLKWNQPEVNY
ncbi:CCA tRNA nucleotidyltransferase [Oceanobacillus sp. CAU 1775]